MRISSTQKSILKQVGMLLLDVLIIPLLIKKLRTSRDLDRARLIEGIAKSVVAQLLVERPDLAWIDLVDEVVDRLGDALPEGSGTDNTSVLYRAAYAALYASGVKAPVKGGK